MARICNWRFEHAFLVDLLRRVVIAIELPEIHENRRILVRKTGDEPVSVADILSHLIIVHSISNDFGDDGFLSEENQLFGNSKFWYSEVGQHKHLVDIILNCIEKVVPCIGRDALLGLADSSPSIGSVSDKDRLWVVDPIDGTKGYLNGRQFAIAISLLVNDEVVVAGVACPDLNLLGRKDMAKSGLIFSAVKGEGAYIWEMDEARPLPLVVRGEVERNILSYCESIEAPRTAKVLHRQIARKLGVTSEPIEIDSQCKYCLVARGDAALYLRLPRSPGRPEKIWDHSAGSLILEEAGGRVTDVFGSELDFARRPRLTSNVGVIATNGMMHDRVVRVALDAAKKNGLVR